MPYLVASTHMWTSNSEGYGVMENGKFSKVTIELLIYTGRYSSSV